MIHIKVEYENLYKANKEFLQSFRNRFSDVLDSGWFILGKEVEAFENEFAVYHNMRHCIGVASGLDALTLSLLALGLEKESEIIVPSNTYIATILSILHAGYKAVLVEPDIKTYNIDPHQIKKALTAKTRALMVVHLYGKMCDMNPIIEICRTNNLYLLEDCAQAHGAEYKGKKAGTFGDMAAFSFYPTKNLGALGDAGAILTNNDNYMYRLRMLRNYGSDKKYQNKFIGFNSRLDEIQAAFLRIKLKSLDRINKHKRMLADKYFEGLKSDFILPSKNDDNLDVYHIFNIRHIDRDKLRNYLMNNGILTDIHYPVPPHRQEALTFLAEFDFPISDTIHDTTLSLPVSYAHNESDIHKVINVLNEF